MHRVAAGTKTARQMMARTSGQAQIKSPYDLWADGAREKTERHLWNAAVEARKAEKLAIRAARKQNGQ